MIKKFDYIAKDNSLSTREVLVIQESAEELVGIETKYLSENELKAAKRVLETLEPRPVGDKTPIEGYDAEWNKGWRKFKKASINVDPTKRLEECKEGLLGMLKQFGFVLKIEDEKVYVLDEKSQKKVEL